MRFHQIASALGKGICAGIAGTAAITAAMMLQQRMTGGDDNTAPAKVAGKVMGVQPRDKRKAKRFSTLMHWQYGTMWGLFLSACDLAGLEPSAATLSHFVAIWGTALVMLPANDVAPPIHKREPAELALNALEHALYAIAAGFAYHELFANKPETSTPSYPLSVNAGESVRVIGTVAEREMAASNPDMRYVTP